MNNDRIEDAVRNANEVVDHIAEMRDRSRDKSPFIKNGDKKVLRIFPYFVVVCLVFWIVATLYNGSITLTRVIETLCLSFTFCFAVLGIYCTLAMPRGVFSGWGTLLIAVILTCILWTYSHLTGDFYFSNAIRDMLASIGIIIDGLAYVVIGFLGTLAIVLFTSTGVVSVISAYLRKYIPSVIIGMNRNARRGIRGKAERFFMVPDIIDVRRVTLDPIRTEHRFDLRGSVSISAYLFIFGMMISSYLFVNPYFLEVMQWKTMLAITLMLSIFTPALLLPWQIFRMLGAKVESDAPRDYYLWQGAKKRLFTTFATLGAFMMMFMLSVYLGNDVVGIVSNYISFMIPLLVTSVMCGVIYTNNFERTDREHICESVRESEVRGNERF